MKSGYCGPIPRLPTKKLYFLLACNPVSGRVWTPAECSTRDQVLGVFVPTPNVHRRARPGEAGALSGLSTRAVAHDGLWGAFHAHLFRFHFRVAWTATN